MSKLCYQLRVSEIINRVNVSATVTNRNGVLLEPIDSRIAAMLDRVPFVGGTAVTRGLMEANASKAAGLAAAGSE